MAKPRPFDFEKVLRLHRPPVAERRCDISGCDCVGEYRAPKSPRQLTDYFWFCLDHVRAYNQSWDYYAGMSTDQIKHLKFYLLNGMLWEKNSGAARLPRVSSV